jgi:hypothetical protein
MRLGDATVLFACMLGALVYAAETVPPNPAPRVVVVASQDVAPPPAVPSKCDLETWPNITASCLRNTGSDRRIDEARLVAPERP